MRSSNRSVIQGLASCKRVWSQIAYLCGCRLLASALYLAIVSTRNHRKSQTDCTLFTMADSALAHSSLQFRVDQIRGGKSCRLGAPGIQCRAKGLLCFAGTITSLPSGPFSLRLGSGPPWRRIRASPAPRSALRGLITPIDRQRGLSLCRGLVLKQTSEDLHLSKISSGTEDGPTSSKGMGM